jgi:fucose 4-O-acetylase-like acetyltransferase
MDPDRTASRVAPPPIRAPGKRSAPIDIARGLAVMAVVALHIVYGLIPLDLVPSDHWILEVVLDVGVLRLPALALLLGLFIPYGVEKHGADGYLFRRLLAVGYLYVVWSIIQGSIGVVTSSVRNNQTDWLDIVSLWTPDLQLWFLPYVMVASILLVLARPWTGAVRAVVVLALLTVVSLAMWGRNYEWIGTYGLSLLLFSAIGATIGLRRTAALLERRIGLWLAVTVVALGAFLLLLQASPRSAVTGVGGTPIHLLLPSLAATLVGIVALVGISKLLSLVPALSRILQAIGRRTLEIYVMHIVLYAGTRLVLLRLGVESLEVHLVVGMLAGVGIPILASVLAPRLHLEWLFAPPLWIQQGLRHLTHPPRHRAGTTRRGRHSRRATFVPGAAEVADLRR